VFLLSIIYFQEPRAAISSVIIFIAILVGLYYYSRYAIGNAKVQAVNSISQCTTIFLDSLSRFTTQ
jgi:hypothetical protein